ncbi:polyprenyl synthetase family protein [Undibacterium sp. SXout20W]|uniref:polyprenyl synthetase family protein n=1 Tax=Undibacterium sp. SXout20W TaxID=3413051 RepID=UPI003BF0FC66
MSMDFRTWMKATQDLCEQALSEFIPTSSTVPQRLHEAMRYAALDGGKRVRPLLVFAAGRLFNAPEELLRRAAAAVEMIHAYSLVHDDMPCMDDDALRRGKPTVHVKYDEASALLVGDALQAQAFIVLSEGAGDASTKLAMVRVLAQASGSLGMCGGQAIDLASVGLALNRAELEQMHRLKTGALLRAAVLLGAMSGKTLSTSEIEALDVYSAAIGLAFQVVDDILDATADSATLGKTAGKDAADNKPTYVSLLGLDASKELAIQLCKDAHGALLPFGPQAQYLHDLADLIVQRQA